MKILKGFFVYANVDTNEGRGPSFQLPYLFSTRTDAELFVTSIYYAHRYGVQGKIGSPEYDVKEENIIIFERGEDSLKIIKDTDVENIKKRAMDKLTYEEKEALGLV